MPAARADGGLRTVRHDDAVNPGEVGVVAVTARSKPARGGGLRAHPERAEHRPVAIGNGAVLHTYT